MATSKRQSGSRFQYRCLKLCMETWPGASFHNFTAIPRQIPDPKRPGRMIWVTKKHDLFGCIDILIMRPDDKPLVLQVTRHTGVEKRLKEMEQVNWNLDYWDVQLWIRREDTGINMKKLYWVGDPGWGKGHFELRPYKKFYRGEWTDE